MLIKTLLTMTNTELINHFYNSFADGNADGMIECYAGNVEFEDPVFGKLSAEEVKDMWRMLLKSSRGELRITHSNVEADNRFGAAHWTAEYIFSKTGRKIINEIDASFEFLNGKISRHTDHFSLWKWSRQAFGWKGLIFGWTFFMKNGIRKFAKKKLKQFSKQ